MLALAMPKVALATPAWLATHDLSAGGAHSERPQIALDAAGNAIAVWRHWNGTKFIIQAAVRPAASGVWAVQDVSAAGQDADDPQVAFDPAGNAVAVWERSNGTNYIVQAAVRPAASGVWGAPQDLSAAGGNALYPQVANVAGNAVAVWQRFNGSKWIVQAAVRPAASGVWGAPQDLSAASQDAVASQVKLDPAGNAVAVWQRWNGTNWIVQTAVRPAASGVWGAPQDLSAPGGDTYSQDVALDLAGNAVAVWERSNGTNYIVQTAVRPAASSVWGAPQDLSAAGQSAFSAQVELDPTGNAVAVWQRSNGTNDIVQAAVRPAASGVWGAPQDLSAPGGDNAQVALDPAGNAVAVWRRSNGTSYIVQAAVRPAGSGVWGAPQDLSAAGGDAFAQKVAFDAGGNAVAVWERLNAGGGYVMVQAAAYDAAGPVFAGLTIPRRGTAGRPLSFAVSPFDVWSPFAGLPRWSFGDGTRVASGKRVSHTYARAGTYTVRLTQSDTLGNASVTTQAIAIASPTCTVPKLKGNTFRAAKAALTRAHCRMGSVRRSFSRTVKKGRVISQKPKPGRVLANRGKVSVVLSRGRRP